MITLRKPQETTTYMISMDEQLIEVSVLIRQSKQPIVDHPPLTEK
jgi:hypothetical protein